jgi:hypothetical protein
MVGCSCATAPPILAHSVLIAHHARCLTFKAQVLHPSGGELEGGVDCLDLSKPRPRGGFYEIKSQNRCFRREAAPEECEAYPEGTGAGSTFI